MIREGVMISGRYEIMGRIGTGGMADVYKAMDQKLNRYVAVKVLKREFREDEMFVQKFRTEAQSAAGLSHPNIVSVYDVGEDRGLYYIVMELVEGITLKEYINKKGRLTPKEVISIAVQVCSGIEDAHCSNIVHRDIKPQNIIISKEGKVKVTDFGIAKATSSNTISTNAMGSVHYTSPEQARGGFSDAKSDIYSLGITMYEMITGELPFDGDSTVTIALKHLQEDITPPSELVEDIPYSLEQIILKCTQKSPDRRYANIALLQRDLRRSLSDPEGDFVVIAPLRNIGDTRMITPDEMTRIQSAREESRYDEYDDEYDEYDDDDGRKRRKSKKSDIDPKMAKIMKILTIVVVVIFVFILLFFVGKATGLIGNWGPGVISGDSNGKKEVPDLVGKKLEDAQAECKKLGFELVVASEAESEKYEAGYIDSQKTQSGTKLPEGAKIQVVVSTGLKGEEIEVPDVRNETRDKAIEILVAAGFKKDNIKFTEREDSEISANRVCGTTPEVGAKATEKSEITVVISKGAPKVFVPTLVGKTSEEAASLLRDAKLTPDVEYEYSDVVAEGKVISQDLEPGKSVAQGTVVKYVISQGKKKVTIPTNLVGQSQSSAESSLEGLGLKVNVTTSESTEYGKGTVISVQGAGSEVKPGATVTIVVSTGAPQSSGGEQGGETGGETGSETGGEQDGSTGEQ